MKKNCWILLGTMLATAAVAQVDTNALPEIPAPATSTASMATDTAAPEAAKPAAKPKKHVVKHHVVKKLNEPTVNLLPGPATVTARMLNIRGQAGLKGEVIGHLKRGESVTVLSQINLDKHAPNEPAQWAEILLPPTIKVWVFSRYVDPATKTVTATRLNLRGGPGENFSILGRLDKGQTVSEISKKGKWIEIEPPGTAFAFVAAMYLEQAPAAVATAPAAPAAQPAPAVPAPRPTPPHVAQPAPAVAMNPTPAQPPTTPETMQPQTALNNVPAGYTPGAGSPVEPVIETAPPTNLPPRVVSHEGRVRHSISPVAPTAYELYDPTSGNAIDYLYTSSTNLDLSRYDGAQIIVTGEEGLTARWKDTPVMTIHRIYVVDAHPAVAYQKVSSPRASQKNISGTQRMQRH